MYRYTTKGIAPINEKMHRDVFETGQNVIEAPIELYYNQVDPNDWIIAGEPVSIYYVDGIYIRDHIDVDFCLAGNWARYIYVPQGELWIEAAESEDFWPIIVHEYTETKHMVEEGMSYEDAHELASATEMKVRNKASSWMKICNQR
jgi:hypothetical protein